MERLLPLVGHNLLQRPVTITIPYVALPVHQDNIVLMLLTAVAPVCDANSSHLGTPSQDWPGERVSAGAWS